MLASLKGGKKQTVRGVTLDVAGRVQTLHHGAIYWVQNLVRRRTLRIHHKWFGRKVSFFLLIYLAKTMPKKNTNHDSIIFCFQNLHLLMDSWCTRILAIFGLLTFKDNLQKIFTIYHKSYFTSVMYICEAVYKINLICNIYLFLFFLQCVEKWIRSVLNF